MASDDLLTERLLRVIDEGRRVATYKLALLLGLIDAAALAPGQSEIPTRDLAEVVLGIYYPQVRVYVANDGVPKELRQISANQSTIIRPVNTLRLLGDTNGLRTASAVKQVLPAEYEKAVDEVEATLVRDPIPRLQVVGRHLLPFLYEPAWPQDTSVKKLRRAGRDRIRFLPGVADRLVVLGPMLRPLIELHWTRDVARLTRLATEEENLRAHLFGADRVAFPGPLRTGLRELQGGACFYCGDSLTATAPVDHFLAWSRWPNDAIENLVVVHDRCNAQKSDHLAAGDHLSRWAHRLRVDSEVLSTIATSARWTTDPARSTALVRSTYAHLAPGTPLWVGGGDFIEASGPMSIPDLVTDA